MSRKPIPESTSAYLDRTSRNYALYVLDNRAIPGMDGLKSSQRIALHLLMTESDKIKTSAFAGDMIKSELYLHGNVSAEDAVSRLAAPYLNNRPLIRGEGAFGTRSRPNQISAPRYTYVRRSKFAEKVIYVDADIAPQMENHDGSRLMPAMFLPLIPLVLLNGIRGIAIGWSTLILPRSFSDIVQATSEYLDTGSIKTRLTPKYEGFDVRVTKGDEDGRYVVTGKFERLSPTKIRITEIPLEDHQSVVTLVMYRKHLAELEQIGWIADFTDRSRDKIDIEIVLGPPQPARTEMVDGKEKKYPAITTLTDDKILDLFWLQHGLSERLVMLGTPDEPGVRQYKTAQEVVKDFVNWRLGWYRVRYEKLAAQDRDDELFYRCLMAAYDHKVPDQLRAFNDKTAMKMAISDAITKKKLDLRETIVERLAVLPGYRWTREGRQEAEKAASEAAGRAAEHLAIAKSPARQKKIYRAELEAIKSL